MKILFFIALGGSLGSILRFGITDLMARALGRSFPYGTLTVNLLGSLVMGCVFILVQQQVLSLLLLEQGQLLKAMLNVSINVVCCIMLTYGGMQLTTHLLASR